MVPTLKYYKLYPDVPDLTFGTSESACFDMRAYIKTGLEYKRYDTTNHEMNCVVGLWDDSIQSMDPLLVPDPMIIIDPGVRVLIPSGIIFDIPQGYSVRIHPRSSMAIKRGLVNRNAEGIIDSDYYHEAFISLVNTSAETQVIYDGDRVLQGELVPVLNYSLEVTDKKPIQRTDRIGGFGSTGVK